MQPIIRHLLYVVKRPLILSHSVIFVSSFRLSISSSIHYIAYAWCVSRYTFLITDYVFGIYPIFPSHRGDSGIKSIPTNCIAEGTPARPSISRQLGLIIKTRITEKT